MKCFGGASFSGMVRWLATVVSVTRYQHVTISNDLWENE